MNLIAAPPQRLRFSLAEAFRTHQQNAFAQRRLGSGLVRGRGSASKDSPVSAIRSPACGVATTGAALDSGQRARETRYDGPDSLRAKMKALKKAVGAQYTAAKAPSMPA
jgi:hypothetical protein